MKRISKLMGGLLALDVCLLVLSGIPAFRDADRGVRSIIGGIGWFGFLLVSAVLIVLALVMLVRRGVASTRKTA